MDKLQGLVASINNENNSTFMNVEPSITLLSDILTTSPIMGGGMMNQGKQRLHPENFGNNDNEGMDEQLQMALRISLEEEQRRLAQLNQGGAGSGPSQPVQTEGQSRV